MFKNNVFNVSVNTIKWLKASGVRAAKTMAQTALGMITIGKAMYDIDWMYIGAVSITAGVASILTSVVGIPEVKEEE